MCTRQLQRDFAPACSPLLPWLVAPYKHVDATDDLSKESIFNHVHAHGLHVVKNPFGHFTFNIVPRFIQLPQGHKPVAQEREEVRGSK